MKREELTIKSNYDGLKLGVSIRTPEKPIGIIQLVHGMAEHRERYHDFMEYCASAGFVTIIHDHRGHGDSAASSQNYGYFGPDGADTIVEDVHQLTEFIRDRHPGLPLTLFGHSMGSLVVRCYLKKYDRDLDALIVCGSPSKRFGSELGVATAKFLQLFQGDHHRSNFVNNLAFGDYNKKFTDATSPNSWIVSDPAVVAAYDADEKSGFTFTLNGFATLFTLMNRAYSKQGWLVERPDLPVFFVAGADDPCIIDARHFHSAVSFLRSRGYHHVTSKLYPHMRHEILNEPGKSEVYSDLLTFVRDTISDNRSQEKA